MRSSLTRWLPCLLLAAAVAACKSPTAPRVPPPDKPEDPGDPQQGARTPPPVWFA